MSNICIIGAGQLGSRHLQGAKRSKTPLNLTVFDLSADSLKLSEARYHEVMSDSPHNAVFTSDLSDIPNHIDIAIISTSSGPRRKIVEQLLNNKKVKYMILEKVLFQRLEDYDVVEDMLVENGVDAWVNCIRRNFNDYIEVMEKFKEQKPVFNVTGNEWGLMCNLIHFIDYMAFILNDDKFELDPQLLVPELVPAKRKDYFELYGTVSVRFKNGGIGIITCNQGGETDMTLGITGRDDQVVLCELQNRAFWRKIDGKSDFAVSPLEFPFQSQTTGDLIDELLATGTCRLTKYKESAILHKEMLGPIIKFINTEIKTGIDYFPCT